MTYFHDPFRRSPDLKNAAPKEPEPEPVPTGTSKEVLAWVGDDKERAQRALDAEKSNTKPRVTLVNELTEIIED